MDKFDPQKPYLPPAITVDQLKKAEVFAASEILEAHVAIARLDGFLSGVPTSEKALMHPIYLKEALESSEIENINTTLIDVLQQQLNPTKQGTNSQLVINYFFALLWGVKHIKEVGMSSRLIRGLESKLLPQGRNEYRRLQVVIGDGRGAVRYTPPQAQHIPGLISGWEKLVNEYNHADPLVVAATAHYQFEAIHPFEDGNGRTGRMLLTLHLVHGGLLSAPAVHISHYINSNRSEYYRLLRTTTENGDINEFVRYVMKGFAVQAEHSLSMLRRTKSLRDTYQHDIKEKLPAIYSAELVEAIFTKPVQSPVQLAKDLGTHYVTASKYLQKLAFEKYLYRQKKGRHMYYINTEMLKLLQEKGRKRLGEKND